MKRAGLVLGAVSLLAFAGAMTRILPRRDDDASVASVSTSHAASSPFVAQGSRGGPSMSAPNAIHHVLSTGQSLSVGLVGNPPLSTRQPYDNLMFDRGVVPGGTDLRSFVPLVEGPYVETMSSAFANLVARMGRDLGSPSARLLVSGHGVSGIGYVGLKKGTEAYANGIAQVRAAAGIAKSRGASYDVRAVTNVHGEADHASGSTTYLRDLLEWQADYERDVIAITHQSGRVPMFHTQMSSFTIYGSATSRIPEAQLQAHVESRGAIVLVGPKYHVEYSTDGLHLTNEGYRHMGEDYAKAYRRVILEGKPWEPVRPLAVTREGSVITVKFAVPSPPLVLDDKLVTNPGSYGFEYVDDASSASIATVRVSGPDTVSVGLSAEPTGTNPRLRYAFTGVPGRGAGGKTGPRGNLRDSDATVSRYGYPLFNWSVHFDEPVR